MARVVVLGAGVMGTAMTIPLVDNGNEVRLVGTHLDEEIIKEVLASHTHPRLRTSVPEESIKNLGIAFSESRRWPSQSIVPTFLFRLKYWFVFGVRSSFRFINKALT